MKKHYVILCCVIAVTIVVGLVGCPREAGEQVVRYSFWDRNFEPTAAALKAEFEAQNPDIEVVIEITPWGEYWPKVEAGILGDVVPDVFWLNYPNTPRFYDAEVLYEWEGDYPPEIADITTYYTQGMKDAYLKNGKYVVYPKGYDSQAFAINKSKLDQLGIALPSAGATYEEITALAATIQPQLPEGEFALGMEWYGQAGHFYFIYNLGGFALSADGTEDGLALPATIAAVEEFKAFFAAPYTPSYAATQETTASQRYANNQIAMVFLPSWELPALPADVIANTVVIPLPKINGSNRTVVHAVGDAVYSQSENLDAAKKWVAFMNSEDGLRIQTEKSLFFPVRDQDAEAYVSTFGIDLSPYYGDGIRGNDYPFPFTFESGRFLEVMEESIGRAVEEGSDVAAIMTQASAEVKTFLLP